MRVSYLFRYRAQWEDIENGFASFSVGLWKTGVSPKTAIGQTESVEEIATTLCDYLYLYLPTQKLLFT